jgi:hypothetical protein
MRIAAPAERDDRGDGRRHDDLLEQPAGQHRVGTAGGQGGADDAADERVGRA